MSSGLFLIISKNSGYFLILIYLFSLIKLVFCLAKKYDGKPPTSEIKNAICRNFSGMNEIEPWSIFKQNIQLDKVNKTFLFSLMNPPNAFENIAA